MLKCIICHCLINTDLVGYLCYCNNFTTKYTHYECINCHLKAINTLRCPLCNCALWFNTSPLETNDFFIIISENSIDFELKQKDFNAINKVFEILDSYNCIEYHINNEYDEVYGEGEMQILDTIKYNTLTKAISYVFTLE